MDDAEDRRKLAPPYIAAMMAVTILREFEIFSIHALKV